MHHRQAFNLDLRLPFSILKSSSSLKFASHPIVCPSREGSIESPEGLGFRLTLTTSDMVETRWSHMNVPIILPFQIKLCHYAMTLA